MSPLHSRPRARLRPRSRLGHRRRRYRGQLGPFLLAHESALTHPRAAHSRHVRQCEIFPHVRRRNATQRNELQFELFLQMRNKVVQAYQEVMRMQM